MPLTPKRSRLSPRVSGGAAVVRMLVALLISVALPAQAISASAERVWNAAHYHLTANSAIETPTAPGGSEDSPREAVAEHYPMQLVRDLVQGQLRGQAALRHDSSPQAARLDVHAEAHRSGTPHHHDDAARDVVYLADDGDAPASAPERTGKHDHDGFSPAMLMAAKLAVPRDHGDGLALMAEPCISHLCAPGERPPR